MAIFVFVSWCGCCCGCFLGGEVIGKSFKFWKDSATMAIDHYETLFKTRKKLTILFIVVFPCELPETLNLGQCVGF